MTHRQRIGVVCIDCETDDLTEAVAFWSAALSFCRCAPASCWRTPSVSCEAVRDAASSAAIWAACEVTSSGG